DSRDVLQRLVALPVSTWNYQAQGAGIRHLGPSAQDFRAAFGLGEDEQTISVVDEQGVALAAIQGLYATMQGKDARIASLEQRDTELATRLAAVEDRPSGAVANGALPLGGWPLAVAIGLFGLGLGGGIGSGLFFGLRARR